MTSVGVTRDLSTARPDSDAFYSISVYNYNSNKVICLTSIVQNVADTCTDGLAVYCRIMEDVYYDDVDDYCIVKRLCSVA